MAKKISSLLIFLVIWATVYAVLFFLMPNYFVWISAVMLFIILIASFSFLFSILDFSNSNDIEIKLRVIENKLSNINRLSQNAFLDLVISILSIRGYEDIKQLKNENPYLINLVSHKTIFHCRLYKDAIDESIVEKVANGKECFNAFSVIIITNSSFTESVLDKADELGVILWNKTRLLEIVDFLKISFITSKKDVKRLKIN